MFFAKLIGKSFTDKFKIDGRVLGCAVDPGDERSGHGSCFKGKRIKTGTTDDFPIAFRPKKDKSIFVFFLVSQPYRRILKIVGPPFIYQNVFSPANVGFR